MKSVTSRKTFALFSLKACSNTHHYQKRDLLLGLGSTAASRFSRSNLRSFVPRDINRRRKVGAGTRKVILPSFPTRQRNLISVTRDAKRVLVLRNGISKISIYFQQSTVSHKTQSV